MATYKDVLILVDKVTKPLQKVSEQMKKTSENGEKLKNKFSRLQEKLQRFRPAVSNAIAGVKKMAIAFTALVAVCGALFRALAKVTEYADHIDKMSQKIGMSTQAYQKWNYVLSINGGNVDSLGMGFKTLTNQIAMANKGNKEAVANFSRLGVKLTDSQGKLRKQEDVFNDTVKAIQKIENPTEKAIISNKLFGRSAMEMRPLLNMTADEFDKLSDNVKKYGMTLSDDEIKRATQFKDTWTTFTTFLQTRTMKAMSDLYPLLQQLLDKIMRHKEEITNIIKVLGRVIYEIARFTATIIRVLYFMLKGLKQIYEKVSAIMQGIANAVSTVIQNVIDWVRNAINFVDELLDKLGILAYFIPGLGAMKLRGDIAEHFGGNNKGGGFTSNLRQQQINNNTSNMTTNNYYSGSSSIGTINTAIGAYAPGI